MERYAEPIINALIFFPVAAAVFTLPYMVYCYRKYGSILFMRVLCVYSFIFYLMCVYCLAILPFPTADTVVTQQVGLNLIPFSYVPELLTKPVAFAIDQPSTWVSALFSSGLYEPLLNILMFLPLGVFLRYYFGVSFRKTVLYAFLLSLFLELTQLSATYGLAPFPYRVCDVNDLIDNTLGGIVGYAATPLFTFLFPSRERLNQVSYQRGERVSYIRRFFALVVDLVLLCIPSLFISMILPGTSYLTELAAHVLAVTLYTAVIPYFWQGQTVGKALVRIRMVDDRTRNTATFWQYLGRGLILHGVFMRSDLLIRPFIGTAGTSGGVMALDVLLQTLLLCCALWHGVRNEPQMGYEQWTHTIQISTVTHPPIDAGGAHKKDKSRKTADLTASGEKSTIAAKAQED